MVNTPTTVISLQYGASVTAAHDLDHVLALFHQGPVFPSFITVTDADTGLDVAIRALYEFLGGDEEPEEKRCAHSLRARTSRGKTEEAA